MKLHILKIREEFFRDICFSGKNFELRRDDRNYEVGDLIHFTNITEKEFEGSDNNLYRIEYILRDCSLYGLGEGFAILAIRPVKIIYDENWRNSNCNGLPNF